MAKSEKKGLKASDLAGIGIAAAGAAAAGPQAAIVAAAAKGAPALIDLYVGRWKDRRRSEVDEWWEEVLMESGSDEGAAAQIKARSDEPAVEEVIVASLRALLDRVTPTVIPALGMLTREYLREAREPDAFFRAMARLLSDCTSGEYEVLRRMAATPASPPGRLVRRITYTLVNREGGRRAVQVGGDLQWQAFECDPDHAEHLFRQLAANGLADRAEQTRSTALVGVEMDARVLARIGSIVPSR